MMKTVREFVRHADVTSLTLAVLIANVLASVAIAVATAVLDDLVLPLLRMMLGGSASEVDVVGFAGALLHLAIVLGLMVWMVRRFNAVWDRREKATTKTCPFCISAIPVAATRCAHCTSVLEKPDEVS